MRVGLIGTGYWATEVHGVGVGQRPNADLVGVWGRDPEKTSLAADKLRTRAYADLDALVDAAEALTFAVPPDVQVGIATLAAERGRHLLLEKPIATSVSDAIRLERAVTTSGVASIVFFTRRFVPETAAWLDQVSKQGGWDCGRAELAANVFVEGGPFASSPWRREKGALWDVGPHVLSMLWPLLGDVTSVITGGGRGDQVHVVMRHAQGGSSTASLSFTVPEGATSNILYVYGEAGRETAPAGSGGLARAIGAHQAALDALIGMVERPGARHPCDVHFGARVVEVLAAAEQSLASGRLVQIEPAVI